MTNYDVVKKLIGPIKPVGCTERDSKALSNLTEMCALVELLLYDINQVSYHKSSHEYSVATAGNYAANFIKQIKE